MAHQSRMRKNTDANKSALRVDRTEMIIVATVPGPSQKYQYFLGHHYNGTETCWDVAVLNGKTREIIKRHYTGEKAKEHAQAYWTELLEDLKRIAETPTEEKEKDKLIIM